MVSEWALVGPDCFLFCHWHVQNYLPDHQGFLHPCYLARECMRFLNRTKPSLIIWFWYLHPSTITASSSTFVNSNNATTYMRKRYHLSSSLPHKIRLGRLRLFRSRDFCAVNDSTYAVIYVRGRRRWQFRKIGDWNHKTWTLDHLWYERFILECSVLWMIHLVL